MNVIEIILLESKAHLYTPITERIIEEFINMNNEYKQKKLIKITTIIFISNHNE